MFVTGELDRLSRLEGSACTAGYQVGKGCGLEGTFNNLILCEKILDNMVSLCASFQRCCHQFMQRDVKKEIYKIQNMNTDYK